MKNISYTALHNHTMFSVLDGYSSPGEYLSRANELNLRGFAVTEHGAAYSYPYFDKIKGEYPELKVIYGVEIYEAHNMNEKNKESKYYHLVILIRSEKGRKILNKLITKSNMEGFYGKPRLDLEAFRGYGEYFVATSACLAGKLARTENYEQCRRHIEEYKSVFPYFYLEMQSHSTEEQVKYNQKILRLSKDTDTPFVITTDSHYAKKEDSRWHEYLVRIGRRQKGGNVKDSMELSEIYDGCWLQSEDEIYEIMSRQIGAENVRTGLDNTNVINGLIDTVSIPFHEPQLPDFKVPGEFSTTKDYLRHLTEVGWRERGCDRFDTEKQNKYRSRLEYEFNIICDMKYDGYFLIVWIYTHFQINRLPDFQIPSREIFVFYERYIRMGISYAS